MHIGLSPKSLELFGRIVDRIPSLRVLLIDILPEFSWLLRLLGNWHWRAHAANSPSKALASNARTLNQKGAGYERDKARYVSSATALGGIRSPI
jgi:hypothetical protein